MYTNLVYIMTKNSTVTLESRVRLSDFDLELAYVQASELEHLMCGPSSFVMFNTTSQKLIIFGDDVEVVTGSLHETYAADVLKEAQTLKATFSVRDSRCYCLIGSVQNDGETYVEAALRTLTSYRLQESLRQAGPTRRR